MITIAIDASTKSTGIAVFVDKELKYYDNYLDNNKDTLKRIEFMTQSIEELYLDYEYLNCEEQNIQVIMELIE